jgi:hypothetical protein
LDSTLKEGLAVSALLDSVVSVHLISDIRMPDIRYKEPPPTDLVELETQQYFKCRSDERFIN